MWRAAQETRGARQTSVYFTGVKRKRRIHASVAQQSLNRSTQIFCVNFLGVGVPYKFELNLPSRSREMRLQNSPRLIFSSYFSSSFRNTFWNRYNSHVLGWIALKYGALLEHIRAYLRLNFCSNGITKHGVIIDFQNFQVRSFVTTTG